MGVLRGLHDVNLPTAIIFVSFWVIGIPFGIWLAFQTDIGPKGTWIGLTTGLGIAACVLTVRVANRMRHFAKLSSEANQSA